MNRAYDELNAQKQGLFKRKCISIFHCLVICAGITYVTIGYGHTAPHSTQVWLFRIHSEVWCGYFLADALVSEWNGTATFDDRCHHAIYSVLHGTITYLSGAQPELGYYGFQLCRWRYYADFFNQNMQLRLILGLFKMKETTVYYINYHILAIGFFIVRVGVIPFFWISFYQNFGDFWVKLAGESMIVFGLIMIILVLSDMQNIDWSRRLMKGLNVMRQQHVKTN